jgi:hypothetical protein
MNINDLFDNIANIFNQFAEEIMAEQARKNNPLTGRGQESKGKDSENFGGRENQIGVDFPKRE